MSWDSVSQAETRDPCAEVTDGDLAYIMYTSGSTGHPKGLMHTHSSGSSYALYSGNCYNVQASDRLGNHSQLHFDMSTFEYFTGPSRGATTVIVPDEATLFPVRLAELVERERLTFWYSVPLALVQMLLHGELLRRDFSPLRWVLFGGEPFPPKYLHQLMEALPQARFSNVYGPAEVNQCTFYHVPRSGIPDDRPVPLGQVWDGAEGRILDTEDRPVKPGETGELMIRSSTMMEGYWGNRELTERSLYSEEPFPGFTRRFYRTGDLVSTDENGVLHFHGRKDRQVKIRGYRVELDEVENIAGSLEAVREAAVVLVEEPDGRKELLVAALLKDGCVLTESDMKKQLAERLSSYAVPGRVCFPDVLPRTTSGKIDRRRLALEFLASGNPG